MRWASFRHSGKDCYGVVTGDAVADLLDAAPDAPPTLRGAIASDRLDELGRQALSAGRRLPLQSIEFLPPLPDSDKIIAIGRNYRAHIEEMGRDAPEYPRTFIKHMSSLVGHGKPIVRPKVSEQFDYEGELAVVIGKRGRHVEARDALSHIAGYSCLNDGSVRDYQQHSTDTGKNFHASSSFGPWIVTADEIPDPTKLTLVTRLNGTEVQNSTTDMLIFDIPFLISYLTRWTELLPGDVIATGTPAGVASSGKPPRWLRPGDRIEVEISGIGCLANEVVAE